MFCRSKTAPSSARRLAMRKKRILRALLSSLLISLLLANSTFAGAYYYNWPEKNKSEWNITTLGRNSVTLAAQFRSSDNYGVGTTNMPNSDVDYYVQGGVVTEKHYVFAVFKGDRSTNYVYFANRSNGKIVKTISGNWGHMNALFYDWGTKHVRVESDDGRDGCFHDETFESISTNSCKSKRASIYGVKGLTNQGQAEADGYVYNAGWDSGNSDFGQKWYHQRDCNALFIYKKGSEKKLVKTLYIPKSVVDGELEDVSIDGNGDVYVFFNLTHHGLDGAGFYKIKKSAVGTTKVKDGSSANDEGGGDGKKKDPQIQIAPIEEFKCATILAVFCDTAKADGERAILDILGFIAGVFTIGVGMLATIGLISAGFMYLSARENESQVTKAKQRIREIVLGLLLWILIVACMGLLLPGDNEKAYEVIQGAITHELEKP